MIEQYFFSEKNFKLIMSVLYENFSKKHNYYVGDDEEKLIINLMEIGFEQFKKNKGETLKDYLLRLNKIILNKGIEIIEKQLEEVKLQKKINMKKKDIINNFEEMKKNREEKIIEKQENVLDIIKEDLNEDNSDIINNYEKLNNKREIEQKKVEQNINKPPNTTGADLLIQQPKEFKDLVDKSFNDSNYIKEEYLLIDSRDRNQNDYPNPNNYQIDLIEEYKDILSISLISSNIPKSQYLINSNNNKLNFIDSNSNEYEIQIPIGNYTIDELTTQITNSLNSTPSSDVYTVSSDSKTNKITISTGSNFQLLFNGGTENYNNTTRTIYKENSIGKLLGFLTTDLSGSNSYTSQNQYNLNGPTYILLHIDDLENLNGIKNSIIDSYAKIPLDTNQNEYKFFKEHNDYNVITEFTPPLSKLAQLNIRFLNYDNTEYDFGGLEHSFLLKIKRLNQSQNYFMS